MVSFDPIPEDMWEDWKWFVYPEGHILGMREGRHRVESSGVVLIPCYIVNLPKLIMSEVMWASRTERGPDGERDTYDYLRTVHVDVDSLIDEMIFMLSQYPMVVLKKVSPDGSTMKERIEAALATGDELILLDEEGAPRTLAMYGLEVRFFNPFAEREDDHEEIIGIIAAERCINELMLAKVDAPGSHVREAILSSMHELEERGLVDHGSGVVTRMTERGRRLLELEPVIDAMACRCEVEGPSG